MTILERLRRGVATKSAEETRHLAADFAATLPVDATVALRGDLGVGKTTFVQGLARGFGIEADVTSPTFTVYTLYRAPASRSATGGAAVTLVHLDAYRLGTPAEMDALMVEDFLTTPYCLAVEWPDKISDWLPKDTHWLSLEIAADGRHRLRLRGQGTS